jgi:Flp pilus assembly protein TadG
VVPVKTRSHESERGAVAIITALVAVMLFIIAALVVDIGLAKDTRRQSQNAADASALAAGNVLYQTGATCTTTPCWTQSITAAKDYALANFGVPATAWASCTDSAHLPYVVSGQSQCISFNSASNPTRVRVKIPVRDLKTTFGNLAGVSNIPIATAARAVLNPGGNLSCGLCVLGSGMLHDLQNGDATVAGASIHFNGNVSVSNNGLVSTTGTITVEGSAGGPLSKYDPDPTVGTPPIADPLAGLVLPPAAMATLSAKTNPCSEGGAGGPGIYTARNLRNATCTLAAGLYVIRSGTWDMAGNASTLLRGTGVTLYFTCSTGTVARACNPGETGATLDASGNGTLDIDGPTTGPLKGLSIVYDRNNAATLRMTGNGFTGTTGTIYAASGKLQMNGNGCANTTAAIVVKDLEFNGNPACLMVNFDGALNYQVPPGNMHLDQ